MSVIRSRVAVRLALVTLTGSVATRGAGAQCVDGTPPPCAVARPSAPRVMPAPEVRAKRFLLLPFRNVTRAPQYDWLVSGAPLMLGDALSQYKDLYVVSDQQLTAARRRMSLSAESVLDEGQTRRLVEETGGWTVVTGNVLATGGRVRVTMQAIDQATARVVARTEADVAADADVRTAFDQLTVALVGPQGTAEPMAGIAALTTNSADAYRAYLRGIGLLQRSAYGRARQAFEEAVKLDSTFALAWARLSYTSVAANPLVLVDAASPAYRAVSQAVRFSSKLPPRERQMVRVLQLFLQGSTSRARAISDSLVREDPDDIETREQLALIELLDPLVDTLAAQPRLRTSWNRAVLNARAVIDQDPGRRHMYALLAYAYGTAAGLWGGEVPGYRREAPWMALLMGPVQTWFRPVLRDTLIHSVKTTFDSLPTAVQDSLNQTAGRAAMLWIDRWLAAGPGDGDAHLWASRITELLGDYERALREWAIADSLGVGSLVESLAGRRLVLLVHTRRYREASALADSVMQTGSIDRTPLDRGLDRARAYSVASFLLAKRGDLAARLTARMVAATPTLAARGCRSVVDELLWASSGVVRATMDTVATHFAAFAGAFGSPGCTAELAGSISYPGQGPRPNIAAALLSAADSLSRSGNEVVAYRARRLAGAVDTARRRAIMSGTGGPAALVVQKRFDLIGSIADSYESGCSTFISDIALDRVGAKRAMDTVAMYYGQVLAIKSLADCAETLASTVMSDSTTSRRAAAGGALLRAADSLLRSGSEPRAYAAARAAWNADSSTRPLLLERPWFANRSRTLALGARFTATSAIVAGDSAVLSFARIGAPTIDIASKGFPQNWLFRAVATSRDTLAVLTLRTSGTSDSTIAGSVADVVARTRTRLAFALPANPRIPDATPTLALTSDGFRVVVRGPLVDALRRLRPDYFHVTALPCIGITEGLCSSPDVRIEYR